jgi:MFS family permease
MMERLRSTYKEYPRAFWILVGSSFIDRLGSTLIFPFFALYITQKFSVGMTQAGILLAIFSVSGLVGSMLGGALADRFGRRGIVLFGLTISALSSVAMGLVEQLGLFYILAIFVGLLSDVGGPARQAMIADLLPSEQRAEGFGILRVVANLAWIFGPTIGGFLAARSYLTLFILDAISSMITAAIVYRMIPETLPESASDEEAGDLLSTLRGYGQVARDSLFLQFVLASMLMTLVYIQMYSTLSVYLRDVHGLPTQGFGALLSMNAGLVVIAQFWITRRVSRRPPLLMMALGSGFYLVGFLAYGLVSGFVLFTIAMLFITVGEMVVMPVSQALAARFAPEDKRARYLAFFGLSWAIPSMIGPWLAGVVMDTLDPRWVWYASGILLGIAILAFLQLHRGASARIVSSDATESTIRIPTEAR